MFVKPAGGWASATETAKLTASDGAAGDDLGQSVAISGDTIVAGAFGADGERQQRPRGGVRVRQARGRLGQRDRDGQADRLRRRP